MMLAFDWSISFHYFGVVTLTLPHPHQLIADILDLFNTFADDLRGLSYNFAV